MDTNNEAGNVEEVVAFDFDGFGADVAYESLTVQVKEEAAPYINTTSTPGNMKLNVKACKVLQVPYGAVNTEDKSDPGVRIDFRRQKWAGKDAIAVYLHPKDSKNGSKLASPSGLNGGILQCSSANAWNNMEGDKQTLKHYEINANDNADLFKDDMVCTLAQAIKGGMIKDGLWTQLAEDNKMAKAGTYAYVFYKLTWSHDEAKRVTNNAGRPKKEKKEEGTEEAPFTDAIATEQNVTVEDNSDASGDFL